MSCPHEGKDERLPGTPTRTKATGRERLQVRSPYDVRGLPELIGWVR